MKPIFCKECKWNKNGWCYKYECNGPKRVEVCPKYRDEDLKEGCEYCNVKYGKEKLITQGCYNNLYTDKDEYDNLHIIAKADGIASFKIEYCPFCGRKLSEV